MLNTRVGFDSHGLRCSARCWTPYGLGSAFRSPAFDDVVDVAGIRVSFGRLFSWSYKSPLETPHVDCDQTWALAHLLVNGDLPSILLFGSFLVWAVIDRISVKRRGATVSAAEVGATLATTSKRNDIIAVLGGLAIYAGFVVGLHEIVVGVPLF